MNPHTVLTRGRRAAEALMTDQCRILRPGDGAPVYDATGNATYPPYETLYEGRCRVQMVDSLDVRVVEFGGQAIATGRVTVSIPIGDDDIRTEDIAVIDACRRDPQLVGNSYRIEMPSAKSHATARRFRCELTDPSLVGTEEEDS